MLFSVILFLVILCIIICVDLSIQFNTWQSRIKIGRYDDIHIWKQDVLNKSIQWLRKTPTIKLTDNSRLVIIDMLRGNYKRDAIQHWQEAALVLGLSESFTKTQDKNIKRELERYIDRKIGTDQNWKNPITESDGVILGYALIQLSWVDHQKLKPAYDALWKLIRDLKGDKETVSYKKHTQAYRYVDTIGFICPFLVAYGQKFDVLEAVDLAIKQIEEFNTYAMFGDDFIPCHTYTVQTKLPVGLFGWGRGLGWYAIGLIDAWNVLDDSHPRKSEMTQWVEKFARMCMRFQRANGSWGWIVMQDDSRSDSSTTATLTWFLQQASKIHAISETTERATEKSLQYLRQVTRRDGAIDFSQGDTKGIGIHSQEFDILPFTQGFVLRALMVNN